MFLYTTVDCFVHFEYFKHYHNLHRTRVLLVRQLDDLSALGAHPAFFKYVDLQCQRILQYSAVLLRCALCTHRTRSITCLNLKDFEQTLHRTRRLQKSDLMHCLYFLAIALFCHFDCNLNCLTLVRTGPMHFVPLLGMIFALRNLLHFEGFTCTLFTSPTQLDLPAWVTERIELIPICTARTVAVQGGVPSIVALSGLALLLDCCTYVLYLHTQVHVCRTCMDCVHTWMDIHCVTLRWLKCGNTGGVGLVSGLVPPLRILRSTW